MFVGEPDVRKLADDKPFALADNVASEQLQKSFQYKP